MKRPKITFDIKYQIFDLNFSDVNSASSPTRGVILAHCHFDIALLPPWSILYIFPGIYILILRLHFFLPPFWFRFIMIKNLFPELSWTEQMSSAFLFELHYTTHPCVMPASSSQLDFSCSDELLHILTINPSVSSQKSRSPRPFCVDWKKWGADIASSFSILVALLIYWGAFNITHVRDLYKHPPTLLFAQSPSKWMWSAPARGLPIALFFSKSFIHR